MIHIVQRASWLAKSPTRTPTPIPANRRKGSVAHWNGPPLKLNTAQPTADLMADEMEKLRGIQRYHMTAQYNSAGDRTKSAWSDAAYSFAAGQSGAIYDIRGLSGDQFANGGDVVGQDDGSDSQWYTILFLIGEGEEPTAAAIKSATALVAYLREQGAGDEVLPHSDFKVKACPGDHVRSWARQLHNSPIDLDTTVDVSGEVHQRLARGAYGDRVGELQTLLEKWGFDPGPIDNDFGPATEAALMRFQVNAGVPVTRVWDEASYDAANKRLADEAAAKAAADAAAKAVVEVPVGGLVPGGVTSGATDMTNLIEELKDRSAYVLSSDEVIDTTARRKARVLQRDLSALKGDVDLLTEQHPQFELLVESMDGAIEGLTARLNRVASLVERHDALVQHLLDYEQ